ncbi:glycosyltransferase WbsX family protein [Hymenobacter terrestris]|uniref:Glycoside hydrolase family 99-like domain-containing protein n=1 Tax=Hymenobacter terrestris TaxID=2748310 RepID=A0ABX2Q887_9BACT|nr:glycoside hydrolase family 99-like domain-containing protein [Hymenobacter terrestris]NVO85919.1 glycoside hydrolase family 99-like domain-containing protein [Hymenobacter terrestris]
MAENALQIHPALRALAIYLPQFHPVAENDAWWGKGFTEWTNVAKARPRFPGHYQPQLPADLGFYDLRLAETRAQQAELARQYGISGFCYYHYWFNGRRILERPFEEVLRSGQPDFPFCLCWANENWTRRWDGMEQEVLLKQEYSEQDDLDHLRALAPAFADPRYIRVDGKPVFIVYRSEHFPDIKQTTDTWRAEAQRLGIGELYLLRMESFQRGVNPHELGFDAAVEFQPDWGNLPLRQFGSFSRRALRKLRIRESPYVTDWVYDYGQMVRNMLVKPAPSYKMYPGVTPAWDNCARRKALATVITDSTPAKYEGWLSEVVQRFVPYSAEENFIFINAWNEWAEGNHLEPCQRWGHQYLEATARALAGNS